MIYPTRGLYSTPLLTHIHNLRFHNLDLILRQPIQLIDETIIPPIRGLDLPLQGLFPYVLRCGKRGLRLCNSSMRSTSETSLSCHAVLGINLKTISLSTACRCFMLLSEQTPKTITNTGNKEI